MNPNKPQQSAAVAVRDYTARKFMLATALVLATYLALIPILNRLAE